MLDKDDKDQKKNHHKTPKELLSESWKSFVQSWKSLWSTLYHISKGIYKTIDAIDSKAYSRLWPASNKIKDFWKRNIIKLFLATSLLWYGWYNHIDSSFFSDQKIEKSIDDLTYKPLLQDLFTHMEIPNLSYGWKDYQQKWEKRYLGLDEDWNRMYGGNGHCKSMIEWFVRMIESGDLEIVISKLKDNQIPLDIVFLALAESYWIASANSWVAWWYWQFTERSWRDFGAIDRYGNDFRSDPVISTDAAIKHLKANYDIVSNRSKQQDWWPQVSHYDKWIYAMYLYNGSPRLIKKWFIASKWNAHNYPIYQDNSESRNYVPRILAIRNVIQKSLQDNNYNIAELKSCNGIKSVVVKKTKWDVLFEQYNLIKLNNLKQKKEALDKAEQWYKDALSLGEIDKWYFTAVMKILEEEKLMLHNVDKLSPDYKIAKEIPNVGVFVYLNKSKDSRYKVYSYVIKTGWNVWWVKKQFLNQIWPIDGLVVCDVNGDEYAVDKVFEKWEKIYVKSPVK